MPYFQNEGHYRSEELSRDKFLVVLSHGGKKNLAGAGSANFNFRILSRHMKTNNCSVFVFKANAASLFGKYTPKWLTQTPVKDDETEHDMLEIRDMKIAYIPVRIYKPKHLLNDAAKKLTGVVYLHGGGLTMQSVGRFPNLFICSLNYHHHPRYALVAHEASILIITSGYISLFPARASHFCTAGNFCASWGRVYAL